MERNFLTGTFAILYNIKNNIRREKNEIIMLSKL